MCETGIMFMLPVTYRSQCIGMDSDLYCVPHSVLTIWEDNGLLFWKICPSHFQQAHFIGLSAVGTEAVSVLGSGLSSGQVASHICKTCDACLSFSSLPSLVLSVSGSSYSFKHRLVGFCYHQPFTSPGASGLGGG